MTPRTLTPAPAALRQRIVSAFPARDLALDGFLRLLDIVLDETIPTAALASGPLPTLHLNPGFLARHAASDEALCMLVMHEIGHWRLGHSRLFPQISPAENIALDAILNALLCQSFPAPAYTGFFKELNPADTIPGCFLRPPEGFPGRLRFPRSLPASARELLVALYRPRLVGYGEVLARIPSALQPFGSSEGIVLLGDHSPRSSGRIRGDRVLRGLLHGMARGAGRHDPFGPGRGLGDVLGTVDLGPSRRVDPTTRLLAGMLAHLVEESTAGTPHATQTRPGPSPVESPLPDFRDRRALVRRLLGHEPLLFATQIPAPRREPEPGGTVVYLDVSGSTHQYHAHLADAVAPFVASGTTALFGFSGVVTPISALDLRRRSVPSTLGTDIRCVTTHMVSRRIRSALLLTDGDVGEVPPEHAVSLRGRRARIDVVLTPGGKRTDLESLARQIVELPGTEVADVA